MSIELDREECDVSGFHSRERNQDSRNSLRALMLQQWRRIPQLLKRTLDVVAASLGLLFLWPIFVLIGATILLLEGRPICISHTRIGRNGVPFQCYKFRTMVPDAAVVLERHMEAVPGVREEWLRDQKLSNDPRITTIGRYLRGTSLDELPQLINVLKGDMSLVGPRPIVQDEIGRYGDRFNLCFSVYPGITGLWQVSGRNNCTYAERVDLDEQYAMNWSFGADLKILLKTIPAVVLQRGSK